MNNLLVIDSAYTLDFIIKRKLDKFITSRDNDNFFNHVWTVHPVDDIFDKNFDYKDFGRIQEYKINKLHTYIKGCIGKYSFLSYFKIINFIISQLFLIFYLKKLIKTNKIKIIRSEDPLYNGIIAYILSKILSNKKLVVCVFGNPDQIRKNNKKPLMPRLFKFIMLERFIEKFILKKADMIIVQNLDNKKFVTSRGVDSKNVKIFKIGRDIHVSHFIQPKKRDKSILKKKFNLDNKKIITFVSRLVNLKFPHHFLEVLSFLNKKNINFIAFVVGEGDMKSELINMAKQMNIDNKVEFVGAKNQEWLSSLLSITNLFVCPLKGRALVEAALGACPTVAYDIDWHSELIVNKKNGILVKYKDIEQLSSKSLFLLKNEKIAKVYGESLRENAINYSNKSELIKYENKSYQNLLTK